MKATYSQHYYKASYLSEAMCKITYATLGPALARTLLHMIKHIAKHNGLRHTIKVLKTIKEAIHLMLDTQFDQANKVLAAIRISGTSKIMSPYRVLYNSLLQCKSDVKASRLETVLNLYTGIQHQPKVNQLIQLTDTISEDNILEDIPAFQKQLFDSRGEFRDTIAFDKAFVDSLLEVFPLRLRDKEIVAETNVVETNLKLLNHSKSRYHEKLPKGTKFSYRFSSVDAKLIADLFSGFIDQPFRDYKFKDRHLASTFYQPMLAFQAIWDNVDRIASSAIAIIPKSGADGRAIAKLTLWDQLLMQKFHQTMEDFRGQFNFFCWKDQTKMLKLDRPNGEYYISTDISAATDNIPISLFTGYLDYLVEQYGKYASVKTDHMFYKLYGREVTKHHCKYDDWEFYEYKCRSHNTSAKYSSPELLRTIVNEIKNRLAYLLERRYIVSHPLLNSLPQKYRVAYAVGQPMGSLGSFPILDISNYLLASAIDRTNSKFRIVGDDIIFNDLEAMEGYINICNKIGIPISRSKTYHFGLAQAVGRTIYKDKWIALPMKFSNHKKVADKRMLNGYLALYPQFARNKGIYKGMDKEQFGNMRKVALIEGRNNTFKLELENSHPLDFDYQRWGSHMEDLASLMAPKYDNRLTNYKHYVIDRESGDDDFTLQTKELINTSREETKQGFHNYDLTNSDRAIKLEKRAQDLKRKQDFKRTIPSGGTNPANFVEEAKKRVPKAHTLSNLRKDESKEFGM